MVQVSGEGENGKSEGEKVKRGQAAHSHTAKFVSCLYIGVKSQTRRGSETGWVAPRVSSRLPRVRLGHYRALSYLPLATSQRAFGLMHTIVLIRLKTEDAV